MKYPKEELLKMYEHLVRARIFTLKMHDAVNSGLIRISFHTPLGQEAVGVGVACAMRDTDWFIPAHRSQAGSLVRFDLYEFIAELFCRKDGVCKGSTFDYHLSDLSKRVGLPIAIVGAQIPTYTGFAWALKQSKKDEVVVLCAGDGAYSEGCAYEAWNLAALYKVPCVYVIENNQWAMSVPLHDETFNPNISEKAIPIGLSAQVVDGNDILAVREAMEVAIGKARNNEPNVVELKTLRWGEHFVGQRVYPRHDKEKVEAAKVNDDPVKRFEEYLVKNGVADETYFETQKATISAQLDEVIDRASKAPYADKEDFFNIDWTYANPETGGEL